MSDENNVVGGGGLFTEEQIIGIATALGKARYPDTFTTDEVCILLEEAAKALISWTIWKAVIDNVVWVNVVDGQILIVNPDKIDEKLSLGDALDSQIFLLRDED